MKTLSLAETIDLFVAEAVKMARSINHGELDFSENSIKIVEEILDGHCKGLPRDAAAQPLWDKVKPEVVDYVSNAFGIYIGEIMRRNFGGEWTVEEYPSLKLSIPVLQVKHLRTCWPTKVHQRIMDGPQHNVWLRYCTLTEKLKPDAAKDA